MKHTGFFSRILSWALMMVITAQLVSGCLKSSLEQRDFFEVRTEIPSSQMVGVVQLSGTLTSISDATQVEECGFLVSDDLLTVEDGTAPRITVGRPAAGVREFTLNYTLKPGDARIYFRAFARLGERMMLAPLSVQHNYKIGDMVSTTLFVNRTNDEAMVQCNTVELEQSANNLATSHGFVYSPTVDMPLIDSVNCPDCDTIDLQTISGNNSFTAMLPDLKLNSTYHVRAFAVVDGIVFYSPYSTSFEIKDGWKAVGLLPDGVDGLSSGSFAAVESLNRAFGGFGCYANTGLCSEDQLSRNFFEFNYQSSNDSVFFKHRNPFPTIGIRRTNASIFSIGDTVYVFFGEKTNSNNRVPMTNFWRYLLQTDTWQEIPDGLSPELPRPRSGAAVFALDGKAYFGGGEMLNLDTPPPIIDDWIETNEVWQFDPKTNKWKRMADLPLKKTQSDNADITLGRLEPVGFSIPGYGGYVGAGLLDGLMLKDFWHFNPPTALDTIGSWDYVTHLPSAAKGRTEAVAFALGQLAYYGTGRHLTDGDLNDFWEFDPATKSWTAREPLPSAARADAFGFSLGDFGYLGGGIARGTGNNRIIWRYEPLKQ